MATLNEKLQLAVNIKEEIRDVLIDAGADLDNNSPFSDYPEAIEELCSGGGYGANAGGLIPIVVGACSETIEIPEHDGNYVGLIFMCSCSDYVYTMKYRVCMDSAGENYNEAYFNLSKDSPVSNVGNHTALLSIYCGSSYSHIAFTNTSGVDVDCYYAFLPQLL